MATWHQQRRPAKLYHETMWTIVTNPPNDLCTLYLEPTEQAARDRLAIWKANGRDVRYCYILKPAVDKI